MKPRAKGSKRKPRPLIGVIMGSLSDLPLMQGAIDVLTQFGVPHEVDVISAHRTPDDLWAYAKSAGPRRLMAIIAGAGGGAAHLPGMVAALTDLTVFGVPIGEAAFASVVDMPDGVPVAGVGLNKSANAARLAIQLLASSNPKLKKKYRAFRKKLSQDVRDDADRFFGADSGEGK